jgi:GLPGLI family protein
MKQFTVLLILLFSVVSFSQNNFQGKATYMSKRSMDMSRFDKMSEQEKKQMIARFKNVLEKTYTLSFNKTTSSFKEDVKLEGPGVSGPSWSRSNGQSSIYKNIADKNIIEDIEMFGKRFLVSEKMEPLQWEMGMETKKIGNYTCYKATLVKEDTKVDWGSIFRRRDNKKKDTVTSEKPAKKMLTVTAWYTPQIPISSGPHVYWGLPGLILEINEGRTTILCTEVTINSDKVLEIKEPTKGKKMTRAAYTKIVKEKTAELKERFKNRGRGNRRRI